MASEPRKFPALIDGEYFWCLAFDTAEDRDEAARRLEAWDEAKVMQEALPLSPDVIATRLLNDDRVHPEEAKALARAWLRKLDSESEGT